MIEWIIRRSVANRFLVMMGALFLSIWGTWTIINTPVDALPDLSDVQVIIKTSYPGQAPQIVENQVTYPLTTTMLSVPGAKTVRGFSQFGDSYVYVIFEDGTDLYWARSRVLEYLNQVQGKLPAGVSSEIGPDATGVGWIFEYALVDRSGKHDLSELRSLQDWFLKFELKTIPNVAEVASVGGVVKQYQIQVNPVKLSQYGISLPEVKQALESSNQEAGGSSVEMAEAEYMVRASGYLQSIDDFNNIVLKTGENGVPVYLRDVARVQTGPEMRRGIAELNGQGEVAGGVVILRSGKNARDVITAVRDKLDTLKASLPEGVEIVTTYDRSQLIDRAIDNLSYKLLEEFIVVAIVCALFLWHVRSALVAIISLPLGLCIAFIVMHFQGLNANIMSLGGIAIAVGAMVDAAIVMIENAHKRLEEWDHQHPGVQIDNETRWKVITNASVEVGPALFISLLIITLSFIPIFTLEGQEGRLFGPLAFTKTYSMAGAAALAIIVIPILMGFWIRGKIPAETSNPLNRLLIKAYHPLLLRVLHWPKTTLLVAALSIFTVIWPLSKVGGEFLPKINEGDLLYMPSTLPGVSPAEAAALLQTTDKLIKSVPEVASVFGKTGKAETATDSAPLDAAVPDTAQALIDQTAMILPHVKITELLLEVDEWTGFTRHFAHLKSGDLAKDKNLLLTTILADAINLGLTKMAESCPGTTYAKLAWLQAWHIRDETYGAALAELVNAQFRHPFAEHWGDGTTSSSDGQNFRTGSKAESTGHINPKYGSSPGRTFYTHISDQYAPFHTKVVNVGVRDSTYVLDGLLYHESDLRIEEHYTDTAGFTDHVFALMHLLGFRFAPRIRDLGDTKLYIPKGDATYEALKPMIGGTLNIKHVRAHWDEILRMATSIKQGTATASLMLRKLGSYPRQNGLAVALRELGRIERTLFILDWLQSVELRRRVHAGLNKGEARNALARAVFFNRLGEIRDRSFEQQRYRASGLNLVTAAIVLWNTVYLERAANALRGHGQAVDDGLLQYLSPLGWEHINLTGDYLWRSSAKIGAGKFRPLRPLQPA